MEEQVPGLRSLGGVQHQALADEVLAVEEGHPTIDGGNYASMRPELCP